MSLYYNWNGYTGPQAEPIAEARLVEAARNVLGQQLPTPALICAALAELLRGGLGVGSGAVAGFYSPSANGVASDGSTDVTSAFSTFITNVVPSSGGPYLVLLSPGESYYFASDFTMPTNVQLWSIGGVVKIANTKVFTLMVEPFGDNKTFDTSPGGTVVAGRRMSLQPSWWGADRTGTADATPAIQAVTLAASGSASLVDAEPGLGGSHILIPAGQYKMNGFTTQFGNAYSYLTIEGEGAGSQFLNGTAAASGDYRGKLTFYGGSANSMKQLRIKKLRFTGVSNTDLTHFIVVDQAQEIFFDDIYLEHNGCEGIFANSMPSNIRRVHYRNCHALDCGVATNVAAFNTNADYTTYIGCTFDGCAVGLETSGSCTIVDTCQFYNSIYYGVMVHSTWSGYLDANHVEQHSFGAKVIGCDFIIGSGRAIIIPDFYGHTNLSYPTYGPAFLKGAKGKVIIADNLIDRFNFGIYGGADYQGAIDVHDNIFSGSYDAGAGPQNFSINCEAGIWHIHDNMWEVGQGIQFVGCIGFSIQGPTDDPCLIENNHCLGMAFFTSGFAIIQERSTVRGTSFVDFDGSIQGASGNPLFYIIRDHNQGTFSHQIRRDHFAWWIKDHCFSNIDPQVIPLYSDTIPPDCSYKPGDTLVAYHPTATWGRKRCIVGGSTAITPISGLTAAGTSGASTVTCTGSTYPYLAKYMWVNFPSIPSITNKRIIGIAGSVLTFSTALEATVPAGTAVSFCAPVFAADTDLTYHVMPGMTAGDVFYADSTTTLTRLPASQNGTYMELISGLPAWVDATARLDLGNSGANPTIVRSPLNQHQKITLSVNAIINLDVSQIPSGGFLILDVYQNATTARTLGWTVSSGTFGWVNGGGTTAPTMTTTLGHYDRYVFEKNETTVLTAWASFQNGT